MDNSQVKQLSLLVHLANVDNDFAVLERQVILNVGRRYGFDDHYIQLLMDKPLDIEELSLLDYNSKYESIYDCVQMMLIDGIINKKEIVYCQMIAIRLGFKAAVVQFLTDHMSLSKEQLCEEVLNRGLF
jgi:uncharacterized membrane protein YebE (DUF533 family)